jgi:NAD(P) transhydrogenase subunit alpha
VKPGEDGADATFAPDFEDEVLAGCLLTRDGAVCHAPTAELVQEEVGS